MARDLFAEPQQTVQPRDLFGEERQQPEQIATQPQQQTEGFQLPGSEFIQENITGPEGLVGKAQSGVEQVLSNVPGIAPLAEFAAGSNRTLTEVIDFFGPGSINAAMRIAGVDAELPELRQSLPGIEGGFMEEGLARDITRAAGETAPLALGVGQALRSAAQQLPKVAPVGEGVAKGVLRQVGSSTAKTDVFSGAAAGAGGVIGGEAGEKIGGETGRQVGELVGTVAAPLAAIPIVAARSTASTLLKKSAPSVDELKATARGIYSSLDDSGVTIPSRKFDQLANKINARLQKEGADINLTPETNAVIKRLGSEIGESKTLTQIDTLRKVAQGAAQSINPNERRLGGIAVNEIDDFLNGIGADVVGGKEAGVAFKSARDLWQRAKKTEILDQAVLNAKDQASGFENGLRTQFRQVLKRINTGKERGFTTEETEAIRKVVNGTNAGNVARFLGKFGVMDGVTSRSLTTLGGIGVAGAATGSPGVAAAVPLIGQVSGALAQRLTQNNAQMASAIIRAGKNGSNIASAYIKHTPRAQQSSSELAELFIKGKVPVNSMSTKSADAFVSDAALIAAIALANDKKDPKDK